jgi:VanZ family protein
MAVRAGLHFRRLWQFLGFVLIAAVIVASLVPEPPQIPGDAENWLGHTIVYGSMMGWFARLHPTLRARVGWVITFAAMGVAIEFAQEFTGYRTYDERDMLANAVGVIAGWFASPPRLPDGIATADLWLAKLLRRR